MISLKDMHCLGPNDPDTLPARARRSRPRMLYRGWG
jgi:hypothetical protein